MRGGKKSKKHAHRGAGRAAGRSGTHRSGHGARAPWHGSSSSAPLNRLAHHVARPGPTAVATLVQGIEMNYALRSMLVMAFALLLSSCGDDTLTDLTETLPGSYTLQTVNGDVLPRTVSGGAEGEFTVLGGTLEVRHDGSFVETLDVEVAAQDGSTAPGSRRKEGSWSIVGSAVQFDVDAEEDRPAFSFQGFVAGGALTYTASGVTAVYTRD
jgi:hypothetical protein